MNKDIINVTERDGKQTVSARELGISENSVGKIANENHLKQEPIYGKLEKVQLNDGRWVDIFSTVMVTPLL